MNKIFSLRGFQVLILILIAGFVGYFIGTQKVNLALKNYRPIISVTPRTPPPGASLDLTLFYDILDKVNQSYFDKSKIDSEKFLQGAINGALSSLDDPYTSFFPPAKNSDFKAQLAGEFSGIGAELSLTADKKIVVISPLDGSPAQRAGVKAGDLIVKVDGEDTLGWDVSRAVSKIRGPKGTSVEIAVLHDKAKTPITVKIVRDTIVIKSVAGWVKTFACTDVCREDSKGKPVMYLRLSQFGDKTNDEFVKMVQSLEPKIAGKGKVPVVLDLRNNPGGYLNDAVFIASEFIKSGVIVMQEDGSGQKDPMSVTRQGSLTENPVIVLINRGSASASEIVSGALRDNVRAKLLGENSFGKGTVQQAIDMPGGGSIHISVAKWLTPKGTWVHKNGLKPDFEVPFDASKSTQLAPTGLDNQLQAAVRELLK